MSEFLNTGIYQRLCRALTVTTDAGAIGLYLAFLFLCLLVPYLLGSINSALIVSRLLYHDDIRRHGSGNGGTTNMLRIYGVKAALLTFFGDVLKTALSVLFAFCMLGAGWVGHGFALNASAYLAGLFCILGHIFPIYYRFRGGKGVLCTAVVIGMLSPWVLLIEVVIFVATVAITKYVSVGSMLCAAVYPLFYSALIRALFSSTAPGGIILLIFTIAALLLWKHRPNFQRLRNHEESRISFRRPAPAGEQEIAAPPKDENRDEQNNESADGGSDREGRDA